RSAWSRCSSWSNLAPGMSLGALTSGRRVVVALLATAALFAIPAAAQATTFTVATATDAHDPTPANTTCDAPCSLRGAVETANSAASPGADQIDLPSGLGPYTLSLGQLLNGDALTVNGTGGGRAVISGGNVSRIILSSAAPVTLQHVELTAGRATPNGSGYQFGGGLEFFGNTANDDLTLSDVKLDANQALGDDTRDGVGGAVLAELAAGGVMTVTNAEISGNQAGDGALASGDAGGIWVAGPNLQVSITNSQIHDNIATGELGADCAASGFCAAGGAGGGITV